jgi:hypothetical protein
LAIIFTEVHYQKLNDTPGYRINRGFEIKGGVLHKGT